MKYAIKIRKISTVNELENAWNNEDYKQLLERFNFPDAQSNDPQELQELLFMAITDFETDEAAKIVLDYTLSEHLTEGQIEQLSHEMLLDKVSEEYPVISLHKALFNTNQLLYKAYNGKFHNAEATIVDFEITPLDNTESYISKEIVLKCFAKNLDNHSLILRLFKNKINAIEAFEEANDVIWELQKKDSFYKLITSDYWMNKNEILSEEFNCEIEFFEEES
ncbi:MAG: hypothetical protein ABS28_01440 [Cryomorphaceae bacterium BACL22 MAG-120619-bin32]|jgi:hypothetical protein|nr:MAG: hypothetical protein ABS28_01440 [Cryomorphaceae bacterium BACL22 MAG-120619-bin32]